MNKEKFEELLKSSDNKLDLFRNKDDINECKFSNVEFLILVSDYLSDDEKVQLLNFEYFKTANNTIKLMIATSIKDESKELEGIIACAKDKDLLTTDYTYILKEFSDGLKEKILESKKIITDLRLDKFDLDDIIFSLPNELKKKYIMNDKFLEENDILDERKILISKLDNDSEKLELLEKCRIDVNDAYCIIRSLKDVNLKIEFLLKNPKISILDKRNIIASFDLDEIDTFMKQHKSYIDKFEIKYCDIVSRMDDNKIKEVIEKIGSMNILESEKKEIIVTACNKCKNIDLSSFPKEIQQLKNIKFHEYTQNIVIDFDRNLSDYAGLDRLIAIDPRKYTKEEKEKLKDLIKICPNLSIGNDIDLEYDHNFLFYKSTPEDYLEGELWIDSVIESIKEDYTDLQKIALIDNAIGKKISYSPNFETEVFDEVDCRAIWKIISSGYGICNGISSLEQYMLSKVGVKSEIVSSDNHAFLKLKNLRIKDESNVEREVTTLIDPTWNLAAGRFGAKPNYFCISYDTMRKGDIDENGNDLKCHKNDEKCSDAKFELSDKALRNVYHSVGIIGENRIFEIAKLIQESEEIDKRNSGNVKENIGKQLKLFAKKYPSFVKCQNSSMNIIGNVLLNKENMNPSSRVVSRVYERNDKEKNPLIYVFVDDSYGNRDFYIARKNTSEFVKVEEKDFVKEYECFEKDIEFYGGLRPYESANINEKVSKKINTKVIAAEEKEI